MVMSIERVQVQEVSSGVRVRGTPIERAREEDPVAAIAVSKSKGRDSENRRLMQSMDAEQPAQKNMNHRTSGTELELGSVSRAFTGAWKLR